MTQSTTEILAAATPADAEHPTEPTEAEHPTVNQAPESTNTQVTLDDLYAQLTERLTPAVGSIPASAIAVALVQTFGETQPHVTHPAAEYRLAVINARMAAALNTTFTPTV